MTSQLQHEITQEVQTMEKEWENLRAKTKSKLSANQPFYNNAKDYNPEFENKKNDDRHDINRDLNSHEKLAARMNGLARDLETQVESSENRLQRTTKHGKLAAFFFAILCAVIGGAIGAKVPGLGQIVAIVVGAVLGFIVGGALSLALYLVLKCRATNERDSWARVQRENEQGLALAPDIREKRGNLSEISNVLNGIEKDNMRSELDALKGHTAAYLNGDL